MASDLLPCCIQTVEIWYRSFLMVRGGHHSEEMTAYLLKQNRDLAPLFADILGTGELRVAASKFIGSARMQPLACQCGAHVALVILGSPFMLLLFRLQVIYFSMIESWEIVPEGPGKWRERIKTRDVGNFQLRHLRLGLEMYLGGKEISQEGMLEMLAPLDQDNTEAKHVFTHAMRVAESWVVAHEFFHAFIASDDHEAFPQFAPLAEAHMDALTFAASFCEQICSAQKLDLDVGRRWLEEFQADLMASKVLLIAIAERLERDTNEQPCSLKDRRFRAARILLNGVATAIDAIHWVDVQRASPGMPKTVVSPSHPSHDDRWELITQYIKHTARLDDTVLFSSKVLAGLSANLSAAYLSAVE